MTTIELLRDLRAQRAAVRQYTARAADLDTIAHELNAAGMRIHAAKVEQYAWIARGAARREAEPEAGA